MESNRKVKADLDSIRLIVGLIAGVVTDPEAQQKIDAIKLHTERQIATANTTMKLNNGQ